MVLVKIELIGKFFEVSVMEGVMSCFMECVFYLLSVFLRFFNVFGILMVVFFVICLEKGMVLLFLLRNIFGVVFVGVCFWLLIMVVFFVFVL